MDFTIFSINEWLTIIVIIAQGGIVYYRLKKVEQSTESFNKLFVEFAVHKNELKNHQMEFDKHSIRMEKTIKRIDDRLSGIESHAYEIILKNMNSKE